MKIGEGVDGEEYIDPGEGKVVGCRGKNNMNCIEVEVPNLPPIYMKLVLYTTLLQSTKDIEVTMLYLLG